MKLFFKAKPVLDEREMMDMYRIEHHGLWAMYTLLCTAVVIQLLLGAPPVQMAGEIAVILIVSVGMIIAYARRGIWDDSSRPDVRGNAVYSAVSSVGVALVVLAGERNPAFAALAGAVMFLLCFGLLSVLMRYVQRRQEAQSRALEEESDEESEQESSVTSTDKGDLRNE